MHAIFSHSEHLEAVITQHYTWCPNCGFWYHSPHERNQGSLEKWLILGLGKETYKMRLEYLVGQKVKSWFARTTNKIKFGRVIIVQHGVGCCVPLLRRIIHTLIFWRLFLKNFTVMHHIMTFWSMLHV